MSLTESHQVPSISSRVSVSYLLWVSPENNRILLERNLRYNKAPNYHLTVDVSRLVAVKHTHNHVIFTSTCSRLSKNFDEVTTSDIDPAKIADVMIHLDRRAGWAAMFVQ